MGAQLDFRVTDAASFGSALKEFRTARGLTQTELAGAAGLHRSYLAALEGGHATEQLVRLLDLFGHLGVEVTLTMREGGDAGA